MASTRPSRHAWCLYQTSSPTRNTFAGPIMPGGLARAFAAGGAAGAGAEPAGGLFAGVEPGAALGAAPDIGPGLGPGFWAGGGAGPETGGAAGKAAICWELLCLYESTILMQRSHEHCA